jgi:hypothetical protein
MRLGEGWDQFSGEPRTVKVVHERERLRSEAASLI